MKDKLSEEVSTRIKNAFECSPFLVNEEMLAEILVLIRESPAGPIAGQMLQSAVGEWVTVLMKFMSAYTLLGLKVSLENPMTPFVKKLVGDK